MSIRVFAHPGALGDAIGQDLGTSGWLAVDQRRIDAFADATGDDQWIHVDSQRAMDGPFGRTIAHGFLTLSLVPALLRGIYRVENVRLAVNYGLNRVRFPTPVPVASRLRLTAMLVDAQQYEDHVDTVVESTVEIKGVDRPACVAETLGRLYC